VTGTDMKQEPVPTRRIPYPPSRNRPHGYAKYKLEGCRCYPCCLAVSVYNAKRERGIAYGTWQPFVDAGPVREHVLALRAAGLGRRRLHVLSGVPERTIEQLINGKPGKQPSKKVRVATAEALLAVKKDAEPADHMPVDATGFLRRMRALIARGFPGSFLARRLGMTTANFWSRLEREQVWAVTARRGRELYDRLWNQDPLKLGVSAHSCNRARNFALAHGWPGPLAWDDETIDDPKARPRGVERRAA